jgi:hypothetical protein
MFWFMNSVNQESFTRVGREIITSRAQRLRAANH